MGLLLIIIARIVTRDYISNNIFDIYYNMDSTITTISANFNLITNKLIQNTRNMTYQSVVISVALIIFIITMIIFWFYTPTLSTVYPPTITNCPAGWSVNINGTCNIPSQGGTNLGNLTGKPIYKVIDGKTIIYTTDPNSNGMLLKDMYGNNILAYTKNDFPAGYDISNIQIPVVDFTALAWGETSSVLCANYNWAIKHNIEWEGITNYNQCQ